jgi:hypothetical protein
MREMNEEAAAQETPQTFAALMRERRRVRELASKVAEMRSLQKRYFATRDKLALAYARNAEKEIDALVQEVLYEGTVV